MPLKDFNATFADELRDPEFAAAYLEAALEDDDERTFLAAVRHVAEANLDELNTRTEPSVALAEPDLRAVRRLLSQSGLRLAIVRDNPAVQAQEPLTAAPG